MKLKADSASGYRFSALATLAAAVAGITSLSGILRLRVTEMRSTPLIEVANIPADSWPNDWLPIAQSVRELQANAVVEWLNVVIALLGVIVIVAGISSLIALFAHATARRYEVALAAVVGASQKRLRKEQLRNATVNAGAALAIGLTIGTAIAWVANRTWPQVRLPIAPLAWIVVSVITASLIAAVTARAAAKRMASPGWLGDVLAPEARSNPGFGAEDLRRALLHAQFAFTFALLTVAMLVSQHGRASTTDPRSAQGYVTRVAVDEDLTPMQRRVVQQRIRKELEARDPGGFAFASAGALLGVGTMDKVVSLCGRCVMSFMYTPLFPVRTQQHVVSEGFFATSGFHVRAGREFTEADASKGYVVVNDTFAHLAFQGQHAIGKKIQVGGLSGTWYVVIGVVQDVPVEALVSFAPDTRGPVKSNRLGVEPAVYFHAAEKPPAVFDVVTNKPVQLQLAGVTSKIQRRGALLDEARAPARWFGGFLGVLSVAAALIAMLSLAAITLLNVKQQEAEIAARRAVGARRHDIIRMVVQSSLVTAARGTIVGIVLSIAIARAIQMVLPQMRLVDGAALLYAAALLGIVSLIAAIIPARAAASVPPARVHV